MLGQKHNEKLFEHYNTPAIAASYGQDEDITPCERFIFDTYIKPGMVILDIGVGGGRTSPYLSRKASRYVGIDYAPEMIQICREKYPQWEYLKCSATDLSLFSNGSIDVVVIAANMLDDLFPHENRWLCLQECHRVLRENGFLIFSSQNPRAILMRLRKTDQPRKRFLMAVRRSARLALKRATKAPFWRGEGYLRDEELMTHLWTPRKAIAELGRYGFRCIALQGFDYPVRRHSLMTLWYYYVFQKPPQSLKGGSGPTS